MPRLDREKLNLQDRRELYKAMRSAHDGICPLCGGQVQTFPNSGGHACDRREACGFELCPEEVTEIRSWHDDFHANLPSLLERWRNEEAP